MLREFMTKRAWLPLLALPFFAIPAPALADSISPATFSATIPVGGSVTVNKTVTVDAGTPTSSKVDVIFLADTTGSMGGQIANVKSAASSILSSTAGLGDVHFGVANYKDIFDAAPYTVNSTLQASQANTQAGINAWSASGGGDFPEGNLNALNQVALGTPWRAGSARFVVMFGDAPGHIAGFSGNTLSEATVIGNLNAVGAHVLGINTGTNTSGMNASCGGADCTAGQLNRITSQTGGLTTNGVSAGATAAAIQAAITTAFANYTSVGLDLSSVPAGLTASYGGPTIGTFDRSITRTFSFSLTFTGGAPGTYTFPVFGTVDGGHVATESDAITVTAAVPEPETYALMLVGLGMLGFVARRRKLARTIAA